MLKISRIRVGVAIDNLLASFVHNQIAAEKVVDEPDVVNVGVGMQFVFLARLDSDQGGERIFLRPKTQARIYAHILQVHLLSPHDAELVVVGGLSFVNNGHENSEHCTK